MITISEEERKMRIRQEDLARLRGLRPIDDDFMRCIFRDNIPLAQLVLRIFTRMADLVITSLETQKDLKRLIGARSICLDAYGTDSMGKKYDLEIQRSVYGAGVHRARYHSSCMDVENLDAGQEFDELPETYTIFLTEKDHFGQGLAFYPVERVVLSTKELFNDGEHILYINGSYRDDSDIGKLLHDFFCWNPDDMVYDLLRETTRYYKEDPKGVAIMCEAFEEVRNEGRNEGRIEGKEQTRIESIQNLMKTMALTAQQAMDALLIPIAEQADLLAKLS